MVFPCNGGNPSQLAETKYPKFLLTSLLGSDFHKRSFIVFHRVTTLCKTIYAATLSVLAFLYYYTY